MIHTRNLPFFTTLAIFIIAYACAFPNIRAFSAHGSSAIF